MGKEDSSVSGKNRINTGGKLNDRRLKVTGEELEGNRESTVKNLCEAEEELVLHLPGQRHQSTRKSVKLTLNDTTYSSPSQRNGRVNEEQKFVYSLVPVAITWI